MPIIDTPACIFNLNLLIFCRVDTRNLAIQMPYKRKFLYNWREEPSGRSIIASHPSSFVPATIGAVERSFIAFNKKTTRKGYTTPILPLYKGSLTPAVPLHRGLTPPAIPLYRGYTRGVQPLQREYISLVHPLYKGYKRDVLGIDKGVITLPLPQYKGYTTPVVPLCKGYTGPAQAIPYPMTTLVHPFNRGCTSIITPLDRGSTVIRPKTTETMKRANFSPTSTNKSTFPTWVKN